MFRPISKIKKIISKEKQENKYFLIGQGYSQKKGKKQGKEKLIIVYSKSMEKMEIGLFLYPFSVKGLLRDRS